MLKEELYINGERVELLKSLDPNLTFNIADISKPDQRKADFSKTIELPASKKVNKIFEHIFVLLILVLLYIRFSSSFASRSSEIKIRHLAHQWFLT